jgi:hypothetical protein
LSRRLKAVQREENERQDDQHQHSPSVHNLGSSNTESPAVSSDDAVPGCEPALASCDVTQHRGAPLVEASGEVVHFLPHLGVQADTSVWWMGRIIHAWVHEEHSRGAHIAIGNASSHADGIVSAVQP